MFDALATRVEKNHLRSYAGAFAGTQHDPPIVVGVLLKQQDFELAAGVRVRAA